MKYPQIILTGNLIFIKLDCNNTFAKTSEPKYIAGSVSGNIFSGEIYTYTELKEQYGRGWQVIDSFLPLKEVWSTPKQRVIS